MNFPWDRLYPKERSASLPFEVEAVSVSTVPVWSYSLIILTILQFTANTLVIRDKHCKGDFKPSIAGSDVVCSTCHSLSISKPLLQGILDKALHRKPHTPYAYMTQSQAIARVNQLNNSVRRLNLSGLNMARKIATTARTITDHKRLVQAIATADVKRMRALLSISLQQGCSISKILERIDNAVKGLYQAKCFNKDEIDLGIIYSRLGGPKLVAAMSGAMGLPSLRTIRRHSDYPRLVVSNGSVRISDIRANIGAVSLLGSQPPRRGNSIMFDEVAIEERGRWCARQQGIVGGCREHAGSLGRMIKDFPGIELFSKQIHNGACHWGGEMTVGAISSLGPSSYYARPLLLSPTCKTEGWKAHADLLRSVLEQWKEHSEGESKHGPIWSMATDGDAKRRRALHSFLMDREVDPLSPLGEQLSHLPLMNLFTGKDDVTMDFDAKHIFKRTFIKPT